MTRRIILVRMSLYFAGAIAAAFAGYLLRGHERGAAAGLMIYVAAVSGMGIWAQWPNE